LSDNLEQINVEVPAETKELAKGKLEHGGLTRVVRETLERIAHGEQSTEIERVKDQLADLRDTRQSLQKDRNRIDDELDDIERKIERAENRLDELRDKQGEYEGALQMIEDAMHEEGMHVFTDHGQVQEAAKIGDCSPGDVIEDLQERNPELPEERFTDAVSSSRGQP
jgi:chromosome segregation ATPase